MVIGLIPILEVSSVLRPSGRLNQAPTIVYRFCGSSFYGKFQLWYSKVPAVVLKSTSLGTQKYQQWNSLQTRHLDFLSP